MTYRSIIFAGILLAAGALATAQTQSNPATDATPGAGQSSSAGNGSSTAAPAGKKVWTNEDVPVLRDQSTISTVGSSNAKPTAKPSTTPKNSNAKAYQAQIEKLQAEIPPLDAQIAELQAAIAGKPTGDAKTSQRPRGVKADDWSVEMQQLQQKRDAILAHISALQDQARHSGVPANTLP